MKGPSEGRPARRIRLVGVPTDAGASRRGACMGPAALRVAGLPERLRELGYAVEDTGDIPLDDQPIGRADGATPASRLSGAGDLGLALSEQAYESLRAGTRPVFLGGDHSLSMGSVSGVARFCRDRGRALFVLWLDAHADYNTPSISPSGNPHGMSLALLCGEEELAGVGDPRWRVAVLPENVVIFGARSIDAEERRLLETRGVSVFDMRLIDECGAAALLKRVIERVGREDGLCT